MTTALATVPLPGWSPTPTSCLPIVKIPQAYECLRDQNKRYLYDMKLREHEAGPRPDTGGAASDFTWNGFRCGVRTQLRIGVGAFCFVDSPRRLFQSMVGKLVRFEFTARSPLQGRDGCPEGKREGEGAKREGRTARGEDASIH